KAAGGITPDVTVPERRVSRFVLELFRKNMFFTFAVKHRGEIEAARPNGVIGPDFTVSPELLAEFRGFVFADSAFGRFRGAAVAALEDSRAAWGRERAGRGDSAVPAPELERAYAALEDLLRA